jgi:peptide-methionine (S)-S-oxide reductase
MSVIQSPKAFVNKSTSNLFTMKKSFLFSAILLALTSCAQTKTAAFKAPGPDKTPPSKNEAVATFAEGCFWHTEIVFQSLKGVRDAVSGYAGGKTSDPDYDKVGSGSTGHAESVQVYYDPSTVSFQALVAAFFASHNPTQVDGQGPDEGTQYRSIAFYRTPEEKKIIEQEMACIGASGKYKAKIATQVVPFTKFYPGEAYHQEYIANHPENGYVQHVNIPDYLRFRKEFKGSFKD